MSNSIQSLQAANTQTQVQQSVQPANKAQTTAPKSTPQDTVTISKASQQALASGTKPAATGDVDHDGDSH
jgi:hypothetical protein